MNHVEKAGSNLEATVSNAEQVFGPDAKSGKGETAKQLGGGSFTAVFLWRGNGAVKLNFAHGGINAGSRVVASISEYNTAWNQNRFVGNADISTLNVAPYNGGVFVRANIGWNSPINIAVTLFVEP